MMKKTVLLLAIFLLSDLHPAFAGKAGSFFYNPRPYGSEAFYNPLNLAFAYALDTVQLSQNFDTGDFSKRLDTVFDDLGNPCRAIKKEGGFRRFVNRQIFPADSDYRNESFAMIPNYFLHMAGGGMVYRKDAEYFESKGWRYPRLCAAALAMTAEVAQEAIEKKSTTADDEVADVFIFRPIGILLFSSDTVASFVADKLSPEIWPHMNMLDLSKGKVMNAGINYMIRPRLPGLENVRLFSFIGLNNLVGLSHRIGSESWLSWGGGMATEKIDLDLDIAAELRPACGLFYDKNGSLLWSAVFNGTENLRLRFNLYPMQIKPFNHLGFFTGVSDSNEVSAGIMVNLPLGIGSS